MPLTRPLDVSVSEPPTDLGKQRAGPPDAEPVTPAQVEQIVRLELTKQSFSGPLPPPDTLADYERALPGTAERIIAMAESQLRHRQQLESQVVRAGILQATWGQIAAGIVTVVGLVVAGAVGIWGNPVAGVVIAGSDIAGIAGVFIWGSRNQRAERIEKARIMTGQSD